MKHYDWGSHDALPLFLRKAPDGQPWAEVWLGTHPSGPSHLADGRDLGEVAGVLPYMLKALAAARPLSIQCHPDAATAKRAFHDPQTKPGLYSDDQPKPEILFALSDFQVLAGLRPADEIRDTFHHVGLGQLAPLCDDDDLKKLFAALWSSDPKMKTDVLSSADKFAARDHSQEAALIARLLQQYPGDVMAIAPWIFYYQVLKAGQALYMPPRRLHAYVEGFGLEIMTSSDNVLRGGLTTKPCASEELLAIADFAPHEPWLMPPQGAAHKQQFSEPDGAFSLVRYQLKADTAQWIGQPSLVLCTAGELEFSWDTSGRAKLDQGEAAYVSAPVSFYGRGTLFVAQGPK